MSVGIQKKLPRYNGPAAFGARPGNSFFYVLPVSGDGVSVSAENLPDGVSFDSAKKCLSGMIARPGTHRIEFAAENKEGIIRFLLDLVVGEDIQLAPPMGWNSWYCFSETVSDVRLRETARGMVERGLASYGWSYINIDDCWQGPRGGKFNALQGNERFPDMAGLTAYIHSLGLRIGIYSTPWISSFAGFRGGSSDRGFEERSFLPSEQRLQPNQVYGRFPGGYHQGVCRTGCDWFFDRDVKQWAEWGFDFVKVDWHPNDVPTAERVASDLRFCGRDIVFSISNTAPVEIGPELMASCQLCRITGDIKDTWESISNIGFKHDPLWHKCIRPGHWIDPDMLQIGAIGVPNSQNVTYKPTLLSYEEQRTQFSLWSLLSAPLILSCDIAGMDDDTFRLLTNSDVIAIDQDSMAAAPTMEKISEALTVCRKPLADGSTAIGAFNLSDSSISEDIPLDGLATELWSGENFSSGNAHVEILPHGVSLFKVK